MGVLKTGKVYNKLFRLLVGKGGQDMTFIRQTNNIMGVPSTC